jgi:hypothetical protein
MKRREFIALESYDARNLVSAQCVPVFLGDLTLKFDAVGAVLGHGFHHWKHRQVPLPNLQSVHRLGRTPDNSARPTTDYDLFGWEVGGRGRAGPQQLPQWEFQMAAGMV